jgi:hypothetical protein
VKRRSLEETLLALRRVRQSPETEESRQELRRILQGEGSHAVARAAAIVGELGLEDFVPDLVAAFPRFFEGIPRSDPGCPAKTAIVEALRRLEHDDRELYRRGAGHVQMEPVFGGRVDTAVDLRGASALALAETAGADVLMDLANLLADPEPPVRISAARDEMRFVASFLEKGNEAAEAAAIALGESRLAEALPVLAAWLEPARRRGQGRTALLAIATLRRDEAVGLLLSLARDEEPPTARDALAALASIGDATLYERARAAVEARPELRDGLARAFGRTCDHP